MKLYVWDHPMSGNWEGDCLVVMALNEDAAREAAAQWWLQEYGDVELILKEPTLVQDSTARQLFIGLGLTTD